MNDSSMAARTALAIPEILEIILLDDAVDMRTLLVSCQRVSKFWRRTISNSTALMRKLYLKPDRNAPRSHNPLLMEAFPVFFNNTAIRAVGEPTNLVSVSCEPNIDCIGCKGRGVCQLEAVMRVGASWRSMLVRQPPLEDIGFDRETHSYQRCVRHKVGCLLWEGGLVMGDLYGAVWHCVAQGGLDIQVTTVEWLRPDNPIYYNPPPELYMGEGPGKADLVLRVQVEKMGSVLPLCSGNGDRGFDHVTTRSRTLKLWLRRFQHFVAKSDVDVATWDIGMRARPIARCFRDLNGPSPQWAFNGWRGAPVTMMVARGSPAWT